MVRRVWLSTVVLPAVALAGGGGGGDDLSSFTGDGTSYVLSQVSSGNCNFMYDPGVKTNYAALNNEQWESTHNCGRCAEVSCDDDKCPDKGKSVVVYLVDRCPECKHGDLDLSPEVFKEITGSDPARYKIKWQFVDCPVTGNIQYCTKSGSSSSWLAIQPANFANGVASMKIANQAVTMVDSCFYYLLNNGANVAMSAVDIELTSVSGETITEKLSLTADVCTPGTANFGESSTQESVTQSSPVEQSEPLAPASKGAPATVHPAPAPPAPAPKSPAPALRPVAPIAPAPPAPAPATVHLPPVTSPMPPALASPGATPTLEKAYTPSTSFNFANGRPPQPFQPPNPQPPQPFQPPQRPPMPPSEQSPVMAQKQMPPQEQSDVTNFNSLATKSTSGDSKLVPGEVLPADESTNQASILQSDETDVGKTASGLPPQQANTKSENSSSGTSPVLITLVVLAVVGGVALAAIAYVVKKKKLNDKLSDRDEGLMRSFDTFSSPVHFEKTIAKI